MEKKVEKYLVDRVESIGGLCVKFPPLFFKGFPDRICLLPGGFLVFVETKSQGQKPRLIQKKVHERLTRLGFRVEVVDSTEAVENLMLTL